MARQRQQGAAVFEVGLQDRNVSRRLSDVVAVARQVSWCKDVAHGKWQRKSTILKLMAAYKGNDSVPQ